MTIKRKLYEIAVKAGPGRGLVATARSAQLRAHGEKTAISFDPLTGGWVHRSDQGILVLPEPRGAGLRGHAEQCLDAFLRDYTPGHGDVVLDVGAGFGSEALTFARLVGDTGSTSRG